MARNHVSGGLSSRETAAPGRSAEIAGNGGFFVEVLAGPLAGSGVGAFGREELGEG